MNLVIRTAYSELPPPTISEANARSPRYPANQECDPPGNSASPVFPNTAPAAGDVLAGAVGHHQAHHRAQASITFSLIGVVSPVIVVVRPSISFGTGVFPAATVAATSAMPNGEASTLP